MNHARTDHGPTSEAPRSPPAGRMAHPKIGAAVPCRRMGLLEGKHILITGVLTDASLAFAVARSAQQEGAEVVLSGAGRGLSLTKRTARKLPGEAEVLELDVTDPGQVAAAAEQLGRRLSLI